MQFITDKFRQVITGGHTVAQKVELLYGGEVVMDLTEQGVVVDGSVTGARAAVGRSGSCTLVDESGALIPRETAASSRLLAPAGSELRLWRGIAYHDAEPELVPVGTMRFITNEVEPPRMALELYDRAWILGKPGLTAPVTILQGTPVVVAVARLLTAAWGPNLPMNFPDSEEVTPAMLLEQGADPWETCQTMAANIGQRLFFDALGTATMRAEPDPVVDPVVWAFDDTRPDNMLLPGMRTRWEGTAPNLVVAVGENSDNDQVYRGIAVDNDPNSLTRYGGPYGRIHAEVRDEKIVNQGMATLRARAELLRGLGLITQPVLPVLPNPALEVGDIVQLNRSRWGIAHVCIVDGFTLPLHSKAAMTLECRERHVVELQAA